MIGMDFKVMQQGFFDTKAVIRAIDQATRKVLSKFGSILMRSARKSMKSGRKGKVVSRPGEPPRSQKGQLKQFLFFSWDPASHSLVVGPSKLPSGGGIVPGTLEFGGTRAGVRNPLRRLRKIGDGGEIAVDRPGGKPNRFGRLVTYARITTAAQAARANELQEEMYGPEKITFRIEARPYMGPALRRDVDKLPPMWAGSVHK